MKSFKAAFIADVHLYSASLGVTGRAYELRSDSDQKCLAESSAITDRAFEMIRASGSDIVVAVGDLTNNGERASHAEIIEKLEGLNESVPVYAVTSTHDWCSDSFSHRYDGENVYTDVPTVSQEELAEMYLSFGARGETSRFKTSKGFYSRSFCVGQGVRLILVNDDCDGEGGKSGYGEEHLRWLEREAKNGTENGEFVIVAEHHLVLSGISRLVNSSQLIADNEAVAARMADAGVRLVVVGHSHTLRTTRYESPSGNTLTQVNLSALCGHPCGVTYVTVTETGAEIKTEYLDRFTYNGKELTAEYTKRHAEGVLMNVLEGAEQSAGELTDRLKALGIKVGISKAMYFFIKRAVRFLMNVKVGGATRIVNLLLPFGGRIKRKRICDIKKDKLIRYISVVFLSVFDGSRSLDGVSDSVRYTVSMLGRKITALGKGRLLKKEKIRRLLTDIGVTLAEIAEPSCSVDTEVSK